MKRFTTLTVIILAVLLPLSAHSGGTHAGGHPDEATSHWQSPPEMARRANPVKKTADALKRGLELYLNNCAVCHGPEGRGDGPAAQSLQTRPADLVAMAGNHPDGDFAWKIAEGRSAMPGWGERLSVEQIWLLVHFIQSLAPGKEPGGHH